MARSHTAYTEVIYSDNEDGSCGWVGYVHLYTGGDGPVVTETHSAESRADATKAAKGWSSNILDDYKAPDAPVLEVVEN